MLCRQKQEFGSAVREHQMRARSAINDAVMRSSERYQAAMFQLIQNAQNRCEGQVENNERRTAMEIGTQAREALDGQRRHLLEEQQWLVQGGEREKYFRIKSVKFRILSPNSVSTELLKNEMLYMNTHFKELMLHNRGRPNSKFS